MTDRTEHDFAVERATKRVKELRDFWAHLAIYVVVNTGLLILDLAQGGGLQWVQWVLIGWGIGLVAHGVSVFFVGRRLGSNWEARKIAQYVEEEKQRGSGGF